MPGARAIIKGARTHRSTITLGVLVTLSLMSMASGTRASLLGDALRDVVSVAAYPFLLTMNAAQDAAGYAVGAVADYNGAKRNAADLRSELARKELELARAAELQLENNRLRDTLAFVRANPELSLMPATVLQRSKGMLTLDVGAMHGVQPSMCALTKDGIVGIVTLVEPTMSYVASLHHEHCRIGARAGRTRAYGVVQGSGNDVQRICDLRYVNLQDDIRPGDEVVSAGGNVFPAELPIGRLITVQNDGDLYRKAVVRPYANPYAVEEVLLVRAAQQDVTAMAAAGPTGMHAMPDDRTIQERFAP
jgi:rod shape-determining protein MreC